MTWPGEQNQGGGPHPWGQGVPPHYPPPPGGRGPTAPGGYPPPPPPPPGPPGAYGPTQPGGYPPPPGGSGSSGGGMATLIVIAAVAVILIGGGTTAYFLFRPESSPPKPVAKDSPTPSETPTASGSPGASPTDLQGFTPPPPKVAGWQVVVSKKRNIAYDVPSDWKIESETTLIGYERKKPKSEQIVVSGAATRRQPEFCDGEKKNIAIAGVTGDDEADQTKAAKVTAQKWADIGFSSSDGKKRAKISLGAPKKLTFGKSTAVQVTATVIPGEKKSCEVPPKAIVNTVAIEARQGGSVMFIAVAHQDVEGAASQQDIDKVISTIRGAQQSGG